MRWFVQHTVAAAPPELHIHTQDGHLWWTQAAEAVSLTEQDFDFLERVFLLLR